MSYPAGLDIASLAIKNVKPSLLKAISFGSCAPSTSITFPSWVRQPWLTGLLGRCLDNHVTDKAASKASYEKN